MPYGEIPCLYFMRFCFQSSNLKYVLDAGFLCGLIVFFDSAKACYYFILLCFIDKVV